ncbi:glycosyltransferase [Smaragdicoccus niigatensis]|uniref:glycosyltransferase n=1 Tax=Smaragdicoccus niigatensis TaxID=359359 RepID=UPI00036F649D|nr:glycosyltransferase [Smaragdicoccus niigatensis]
MRILFSSLDAFGHVFPLIPLAQAAVRADHEVLFAAGDTASQALRSAGLNSTAVGFGIREAFARAVGNVPVDPRTMSDDVRERAIRTVFGEIIPLSQVQALQPVIAEFAPDLVVAEVGNPGAALAGLSAGVKAVRHGFGRGHASVGNPWAALSPAVREVLGDACVDSVRRTPLIDIYPASLQPDDLDPAVPRILLRPVPFAEPGAVPGIVTEGSGPLIYLTLGTAFGSPDVFRAVLEGLSTHGFRVLVATGPSMPVSVLGDLPPNVVAQQWVPQAEILPHADVVINHGGSGTTLASLGAGVPQLFLPQGADQFINAAAVSDAGAGLTITVPDAEMIGESVTKLLGDDYRARAQKIAAEIAAMPSPDDVAARLVEFV